MPSSSRPPVLGSLALIAIVIGVSAVGFAYTAGWFSPQRLTSDRFVEAFAPSTGVALGHRRNHAKGICFTGVFEANGAGSELSQAQVFTRGQYPVLGRFNLGTADANAPDATVRVRGLGIRISTPDGQEWRTAMIDPRFFPVQKLCDRAPRCHVPPMQCAYRKGNPHSAYFATRAADQGRLACP